MENSSLRACGTARSPFGISRRGHRRFFVNFIDPTTHDTVVASYRTGSNPSLAEPGSRTEVMRIAQPVGRSNHKAGWLGFKPGDADHLYIATGDGGGANDPDNNAQDNTVLLGKMLRVDINGDDFPTDAARNYAIPSDNPYFGVAGARGEIFANGLRNPFRNSFDRATGNLWIADVGQGEREELDFVAASSEGGQNFGWRIREGDIATPGIGDADPGGLIDPLLAYDHSFGAAVTGGYVVREPGSALFGQYLFGDFVSGRIWSIDADGTAQTLMQATELTALFDAGGGGALQSISSFGERADGALLIVDYGGKVVQVIPEPASAALMLSGGVLLAGWLRRRGIASTHVRVRNRWLAGCAGSH
jgi:glucose/arabinose dehydrogenase